MQCGEVKRTNQNSTIEKKNKEQRMEEKTKEKKQNCQLCKFMHTYSYQCNVNVVLCASV